jgi:hypothetical protein
MVSAMPRCESHHSFDALVGRLINHDSRIEVLCRLFINLMPVDCGMDGRFLLDIDITVNGSMFNVFSDIVLVVLRSRSHCEEEL